MVGVGMPLLEPPDGESSGGGPVGIWLLVVDGAGVVANIVSMAVLVSVTGGLEVCVTVEVMATVCFAFNILQSISDQFPSKFAYCSALS